jgi:hypothetical protein
MGIFLGDYSIHGKRPSVEEELAKHGSHNQKTHGGKGGGNKGSGSTTPFKDRADGPFDRIQQNNDFADGAVKELEALDPSDFGQNSKTVAETKSVLDSKPEGFGDEDPSMRETIEDGYDGLGAQVGAGQIMDDKKTFRTVGQKLVATKDPKLVSAGNKIIDFSDKMYDVSEEEN